MAIKVWLEVIRTSLVGAVEKNLPANAGALGSVSGSGRFPGEGNGNPLQYSWLGNLMDRGPVFLAGKSRGQRSLEGYSPWSHKESDAT